MSVARGSASFVALRRLLLAPLVALLALAVPVARADAIYATSFAPEAPGATGSGFVTLSFDPATQLLTINANWSGLSGTTTVSHIHCCVAVPGTGTASVAVTPGTLPGFPAGTTSGSYFAQIDLGVASSFTGGFLTLGGGTAAGATALLLSSFAAGTAYFNIHTSTFPGGEIRGFIHVPEPGTLALLGLGLALATMRRRR